MCAQYSRNIARTCPLQYSTAMFPQCCSNIAMQRATKRQHCNVLQRLCNVPATKCAVGGVTPINVINWNPLDHKMYQAAPRDARAVTFHSGAYVILSPQSDSKCTPATVAQTEILISGKVALARFVAATPCLRNSRCMRSRCTLATKKSRKLSRSTVFPTFFPLVTANLVESCLSTVKHNSDRRNHIFLNELSWPRNEAPKGVARIHRFRYSPTEIKLRDWIPAPRSGSWGARVSVSGNVLPVLSRSSTVVPPEKKEDTERPSVGARNWLRCFRGVSFSGFQPPSTRSVCKSPFLRRCACNSRAGDAVRRILESEEQQHLAANPRNASRSSKSITLVM